MKIKVISEKDDMISAFWDLSGWDFLWISCVVSVGLEWLLITRKDPLQGGYLLGRQVFPPPPTLLDDVRPLLLEHLTSPKLRFHSLALPPFFPFPINSIQLHPLMTHLFEAFFSGAHASGYVLMEIVYRK